jgi:predicted O-methyltransferase YrrM
MTASPLRIRERIEEIYRTGLVRGEDGIQYPIENTSVTPERGSLIVDLCRAEHATATLEIGMAWGLSTLFILEAIAGNGAPLGAHLVTDPFQSSRWHGAGLRTIREVAAAEMIEFHEEPSQIVLPRLAAQKRVFDFAFIDGNHRFDGVFVDLVFVNQLLKPGGVMVFDDTWFDPVYLACRFAETNLGYELIAELLERDQNSQRSRGTNTRPLMRAYRKPTVEAERDFFHFVPFFDGMNSARTVEERRLRNEGMQALLKGNRGEARRAFVGAMQLNPHRINNWKHILRTYLPVRMTRAASGRTRQ